MTAWLMAKKTKAKSKKERKKTNKHEVNVWTTLPAKEPTVAMTAWMWQTPAKMTKARTKTLGKEPTVAMAAWQWQASATRTKVRKKTNQHKINACTTLPTKEKIVEITACWWTVAGTNGLFCDAEEGRDFAMTETFE